MTVFPVLGTWRPATLGGFPPTAPWPPAAQDLPLESDQAAALLCRDSAFLRACANVPAPWALETKATGVVATAARRRHPSAIVPPGGPAGRSVWPFGEGLNSPQMAWRSAVAPFTWAEISPAS